MFELIRRDKDFYDPYVCVAEVYFEDGKREEAVRLLRTGYNLMLARILHNGRWPKRDS